MEKFCQDWKTILERQYHLRMTCLWLLLYNRILILLISHGGDTYTARKHVLNIQDGQASEINNNILFTCIDIFKNSDTLLCINSCYILLPLVYNTENASVTKRELFPIMTRVSRVPLGHSSLRVRCVQHLP